MIRVHPRSSAAKDLILDAAQELAAAGIEAPRFEVQLLLAQALGVTRTAVLAGLHPAPTSEQRERFADLVRRRASHVPAAYLRGEQEFYGLPFRVGPGVLIPRPETELLVDAVIAAYAEREVEKPFHFADVGTGSGCIVIAALAHCPEARAVAFDLSPQALDFAQDNAWRNGVADRVRFVRGSLLEGAAQDSLDMIVSNPPYITSSELEQLQPEVRDHEPRSALDGGPEGLDCYAPLAAGARRALRSGGRCCVEVGQGQAESVAGRMQSAGLTRIDFMRDLADMERIVCAEQPWT